MSTKPLVKSVQQQQDEQKRLALEAVLDKLDAQTESEDAKKNRRNMRVNFRRFSVPVHVHHPGGSTTMRKVVTRDLSAGGLSFIHNGYLHVNTRVDVMLQRYGGGEDVARGTVLHCQHIGGIWHVVGVKFERRIFPKLYVDPEQASSLTGDARDPKTVTGNLLHVEAQELDRRLLAHHLRNTNITLVACGNIAEAKHLLAEKPFHLVIVDLDGEGDSPMDAAALQGIRDNGYTGPLAACTAEARADVIRDIRATNICGLIRKPYEGDRLVASIGSWLEGGTDSPGDRVYSHLVGDPEMKPLVTEYVDKVKSLLGPLAEALNKQDLTRCRAICMTLKGSGTSYGFEAITVAATGVLNGLEAAKTPEQLMGAVEVLQDVCSRLTAEPAPWGATNAA
jgi:CheY-like chemotaxis protein